MFLNRDSLPNRIHDVGDLDDLLCRPSRQLVDDLAGLDGDIMVLGVAGKMGLTVAGLAKQAAPNKRVIGVARFTDPTLKACLGARGVETITCDLLDQEQLTKLPKVANVVFMAGRKFGAEGNLALTWAMNCYMPALVAQHFATSRIVSFSTGCVYPFVPVNGRGSSEDMPPDPPGEYAQSCIGRERLFEHFSEKLGTAGRSLRLNYAIDMRYGVLHDIAEKVVLRKPVDVTMGYVNVIWQGDAASQALRCFRHCTAPISPINVSGPERLSVRELALRFGERLGIRPMIVGQEAETAWLTDTTLAQRLFGKPVVDTERMISWTADWVNRDMPSYGKPTKFEVRDGRY